MNKDNKKQSVKGPKAPVQEKQTAVTAPEGQTAPVKDPVAEAKAKAEKMMADAKAKAEKALADAKEREQKAIEKAKQKAVEAEAKAKEKALKAEERAKKKAEAQALKEANRYKYIPVTDLKGAKYSVAYKVKDALLLNSKLHNTPESAMWTHKAIKRTGAPVFLVKVEVIEIPAAPKPQGSK